MNVQHKQQEGRGQFYVQLDGEIRARLTYSGPNDGKIVASHTEVDDEIRHEDVGYQMVHAAVQYARNQHLKIVPLCPFVKAVFDKKPEYKDVFAED